MVRQRADQSLALMQHWRPGDHFATFRLRMSVARGDPLATFEFGIGSHARILFWRTVYQEEPGVEPARSERRRDPSSDESEITRVEMQTVMPQQLRPRRAFRFEIVKQRSQLAR